jgi:hypothetical protein
MAAPIIQICFFFLRATVRIHLLDIVILKEVLENVPDCIFFELNLRVNIVVKSAHYEEQPANLKAE